MKLPLQKIVLFAVAFLPHQLVAETLLYSQDFSALNPGASTQVVANRQAADLQASGMGISNVFVQGGIFHDSMSAFNLNVSEVKGAGGDGKDRALQIEYDFSANEGGTWTQIVFEPIELPVAISEESIMDLIISFSIKASPGVSVEPVLTPSKIPRHFQNDFRKFSVVFDPIEGNGSWQKVSLKLSDHAGQNLTNLANFINGVWGFHDPNQSLGLRFTMTQPNDVKNLKTGDLVALDDVKIVSEK